MTLTGRIRGLVACAALLAIGCSDSETEAIGASRQAEISVASVSVGEGSDGCNGWKPAGTVVSADPSAEGWLTLEGHVSPRSARELLGDRSFALIGDSVRAVDLSVVAIGEVATGARLAEKIDHLVFDSELSQSMLDPTTTRVVRFIAPVEGVEAFDRRVGTVSTVFTVQADGRIEVTSAFGVDPCEALLEIVDGYLGVGLEGTDGLLERLAAAAAGESGVLRDLAQSHPAGQAATGAHEVWRRASPEDRRLSVSAAEVPPEVLDRLSHGSLAIIVPEAWRAALDGYLLCTRTDLGWGPVCHGIGAETELGGTNVETIWLDNDPVELVFGRAGEGSFLEDSVLLGTVDPPSGAGLILVGFDPKLSAAASLAELREALVEGARLRVSEQS